MPRDPFEEAMRILQEGGVVAPPAAPVPGLLPRPQEYDPITARAFDILEREREPTLGERALEVGADVLSGVGAVVGAPKHAVDWLARTSGRGLYGLELPDEATTGSMLRAGLGLSKEEGRNQSYLRRVGGGLVEFAGDLLDPTLPVAGGASTLARGGRLAESTLARVGAEAAPEMVAALERASRIGRIAVPAERATQAAFAALMGTGAVQGGAQLFERLKREQAMSPAAAEDLLHTGLAAYMAKHALAGARRPAPIDPFAEFFGRPQVPVEERLGEPTAPGARPPAAVDAGRPVDVEAEREFLRTDPLASFNALLTREARLAREAEGLPLSEAVSLATQTATQAGAPRLRPAPPAALTGPGAELVTLSPAAARAGGVLEQPATPPRPRPSARAAAAEVAPVRPPAEAPATFEAWAAEQGIDLATPGRRTEAVERWIAETPDLSGDQRAAVRATAKLPEAPPAPEARPITPEPAPAAETAPDGVQPAPATFREYVEARGRSWPVRTTDADYADLQAGFKQARTRAPITETPRGVDVAATEVAQPTEAQARAGNYRKGHVRVAGLDVSIETEAGSKRRPEWPELNAHYGYVRRTKGRDGDQVDVFLRPETPDGYGGPVHVVNQIKADGAFDEHKVLVGWPKQEDALQAFEGNYTPGEARYSGVRTFDSPSAFKSWLRHGDTTKPVSVMRVPRDASGVRVLPGEEALSSEARATLDVRVADELRRVKEAEAEVRQAVLHGDDAELARVGLEDLIAERRDVNNSQVEEILRDLHGPDPARRNARIRELSRRGSPLAQVPASVAEMEAAHKSGRGSSLEQMMRSAVAGEDPTAGAVRSGRDRRQGLVPVEAERRAAERRAQVAAQVQLPPDHPAVERVLAAEAQALQAQRIDALTGLRTLHAFREKYPEIRAGKPELPAGQQVTFMDLAGFKGINDTMGHDAADLVLRRVADILIELAGHDNAFRRSGDEFFVVLPEATTPGFRERLSERLASAQVVMENEAGQRITVTNGIRAHVGTGASLAEADIAANASRATQGRGLPAGVEPRSAPPGEPGLPDRGRGPVEPGAGEVEVARAAPEKAPPPPVEAAPKEPRPSAAEARDAAELKKLERKLPKLADAELKRRHAFYIETGLERSARAITAEQGRRVAAAAAAAPPMVVERTVAEGSRRLSDVVLERLERGEAIGDNKELARLAQEAFGGTRGRGAYTPRDAYDALEAGVNRWISKNGERLLADPRRGLTELRELLKRLPTQTDRTDEQIKFQQFSTPPTHALVAARAAGIRPGDLVLEPSAGVGGLAAFAKSAGAELQLNELSPRRLDALRSVIGPEASYSSVDAEHVHALLAKERQPDVVLMNPPFSATGGRTAFNATKFGARHLESALERLASGGRLVAIVGEGMKFPGAGRGGGRATGKAFQEWWAGIMARYDVKANLGVRGEEYGKYGTTFPNQIVVIDKTGPTPGATWAERVARVATGDAMELEAALGRLEDIGPRGQVGERAGVRPGVPAGAAAVGATEPGSVPRPPGEPLPGGDRVAGGRAAPGGEVAAGPGEHGRPGVGRGAGREPVAAAAAATGDAQAATALAAPEAPKPAARAEYKAERNEGALETVDEAGTFAKYEPSIKIPGAKPHPAEIVEAATMAVAPPPRLTYRPHLPDDVLKSGAISPVQYEGIVTAGQAHGQRLQGGARAAVAIGDGTGLGKGREIAGVILDNYNQGRRRAIWVSASADLVEAARGDLRDIGAGHIPIELVNKWKPGQDITQQDGILFTTYTTLAGAGTKTAEGQAAATRLEQLRKWAGNEPVIVYDEAHLAKNLIGGGIQARGKNKGSQRGKAVVDLQDPEKLPDARVLYVSATAATEPRNMAYMTRLGLWGPGTAFPKFEAFLSEISRAGLGAMEIVARDAKTMGRYLSRQISYRGVDFGEVQHTMTADQRTTYASGARAWQSVLANIDKALEATGGNNNPLAKSMAKSQFWGAQQRFYSQLIAAIKIPTAIKEAEAALARGESVVFNLMNTLESRTKEAVARAKSEERDLDDLDVGPKEALMAYIQKSFPVERYEEYTDPATNITSSRVVKDANGNPVLDPVAVAMRDEVMAEAARVVLPEGPLDQLVNYFGPDRIAEISGRKKRLSINPETQRREYVSRAPRGVSQSKANLAEMQAFNEGAKRVAIVTPAGGTGFSLHADRRFKNQQRRYFLSLQLPWSADTLLQFYGRVHRSGQAQPPRFGLLSSDVGGERRFSSTVASRLESLGALSKGERKASNAGALANYNYDSEYGEFAVGSTLFDLQAGKVPGVEGPQALTRMGFIKEPGEAVKESDLGDIDRFLNRVLSLEVDEQNRVFDHFHDHFSRQVEQAKASGAFDTGVADLEGANPTIKARNVVQRTGDAETVHYQVSVDRKVDKLAWAMARSLKAEQEGAAWVRNRRSGKVFLQQPAGNQSVPETGQTVAMVSLRNPRNVRERMPSYDARERFETLTDETAQKLWREQLAQLPDRETVTENILGGVLLPIWDRMRGVKGMEGAKVVRAVTTSGERVVGMLLPHRVADQVLAAVGAEVSAKAPAEAFHAVLEQGQEVALAGGHRLARRRVGGEERVEFVPADRGRVAASELRDMGLIEEQIRFERRYFVPGSQDTGVPVLERLMKRFPSLKPAAGAPTARFAAQPARGVVEAIRSGSAILDALADRPRDYTSRQWVKDAEEFGLKRREALGLWGAADTRRNLGTRPAPAERVSLMTPDADEVLRRYGLVPADRIAAEARALAADQPLLDRYAKAVFVETEGKAPLQVATEVVRFARRVEENTSFAAMPGFYSQLERVATDAKAPKAASGSDWLRYLADPKRAVKADEMKWTGLDDYLQARRGARVTRDEIAAHLVANKVDVQEVKLGYRSPGRAPVKVDDWRKASVEELAEFYESLDSENDASGLSRRDLEESIMGSFSNETLEGPMDWGRSGSNYDRWGNDLYGGKPAVDHSEILRALLDTSRDGETRPKFNNPGYQTPGGENYREVLLTLPRNTRAEAVAAAADARHAQIMERVRQANAKGDRTEALRLARELPASIQAKFFGGHFDEPNVLAHVRLNDRVDADGKRVLFVEEIQSDWAQKGRREGFGEISELPEGYVVEAGAGMGPRNDIPIPNHEFVVRTPQGWVVGAGRTREAAVSNALKALNGSRGGGVPAAPFVGKTEAWTELALKRIVRMAAEEGYDRVAWTTGDMQAARYDLSKQVDNIKAFRRQDGNYDLMVRTKADGRLHDFIALTEKQLAETVGKDLAEKIVQQDPKWHEYTGVDLKVGGEGMRGFYDKIVPQVAGKVVKKWGGKVGEARIEIGGGGSPDYLVRPTNAEGFAHEVVDRTTGEVVDRLRPGEDPAEFANASNAAARRQTVHSLDVTPEMRRGAMEWQPLFAPKGWDHAEAIRREPLTLERVRSSFKGAEWEERDGRFHGKIGGTDVVVEPDATIVVGEEHQQALARSATAKGETLRRAGYDHEPTMEAAGATYTLPGSVLVKIAKGHGDDSVIDHEALHVAMRLALTDAERRAVLRKYGFKEGGHRTAADRAEAMQLAEERAAEAYSQWTPRSAPNGLFARIASYFRRVYRSLFPDAESVFQKVREGEAFGRRTPAGDSGVAFAASRRPAPGQRGLPGIGADLPVAGQPRRAAEQADLFGAGDMLQPSAARTTEGREREGPLFTQEAEARVRAEADAQASLPEHQVISGPEGTEVVIHRGARGYHATFRDVDAAESLETRIFQGAKGKEQAEAWARRTLGVEGGTTRFAAQPAPRPEPPPAPAGGGDDHVPTGKPPEFPINLDRIGVDLDVKQALERFVDARRGQLAHDVQSHAEVRRLALQSGLSDADFVQLQRQRGALTAEYITAGRLLREEAAKRLEASEAELRRVQADPQADHLEAERQYAAAVTKLGAIVEGTVRAGTAAARALAAHRILSEGLRPGERFFEKLLRTHPGMRPHVRDRLLRATRSGNQRELIAAAREAIRPALMDKFLEAWKAGLVSGPPTLAGNMVSNAVFEAHRTAERGVAGAIDALVSSLRGTGQERFASEALAAGTSLLGSVPAALRLFGNGLLEERIKPGSKYEGLPGAIPGRAGEVIRLPFRILQAGDDAAKHMAAQAELNATAWRMALRERKTGAIGSGEVPAHVAGTIARVGRYVEARTLRDAGAELGVLEREALADDIAGRIFSRMDRAAHEATFQDEVGKLTQIALQARHAARPLGIPLGDLVAPFLKTPSRILAQAARRTPLGFREAWRAWKNLERGTGTQGEFSEALARPLLGTLLAVSFYAMARAGNITGSGPADDRKRKLLEASGWQPYAVRVGDSWVQFKRLEPLATILGLAADMAEAGNEHDTATKAEKLQAALIQNITEKSWIQGITSLAEAWQDPKRYGPRWLRGLEGSLVPNVVRKAAAALDPVQRDQRSPLGPIMAGIPGLSTSLPARVSGTGEVRERPGTALERFASPFPRSEARGGAELEQELLDLDYAPSEPARTLQIPGSRVKIELDQQELDVIRTADRKSTEFLRRYIKTAAWRAMDGETRKEKVQEIYARNRRLARQQLYGQPAVKRKVREARAALRREVAL